MHRKFSVMLCGCVRVDVSGAILQSIFPIALHSNCGGGGALTWRLTDPFFHDSLELNVFAHIKGMVEYVAVQISR